LPATKSTKSTKGKITKPIIEVLTAVAGAAEGGHG
jgi:hypothetical protein